MREHDIRSDFEVQKILDYVQCVYDNYDALNDGQVHYLDDDKVFVCRLGEYIKIGKPKNGGKAFAFVCNPASNYNGIYQCDIHVNLKSTFHFKNGVLHERVVEYSDEKRRLQVYYKEVELSKEFIFHTLLNEQNEYILTYEESLLVQEMNKSFGFELHFETMPKRRVRNERNC